MLPWQPFLAFYIWGAHWRHLKNTTEPSMCGGDAALCQISLPLVPVVNTCLSCEDIVRQSCAMVPRWRFLAYFLHPVFSASRMQHISDMHSKFALTLHHVWKYGGHPISDRCD